MSKLASPIKPQVFGTHCVPIPVDLLSQGIRVGQFAACQGRTHNRHRILLMLLLCRDVSLNIGPRNWKYPCGVCHKPVKCNQQGIQCDSCDTWSHMKCAPQAIRVTDQDYARLSVTTENWYCFACQLPLVTDSFFSSAESLLADDTNDEITSTFEVSDIFHELRSVRKKCRKNIIVSHFNVNSLRNQFYELFVFKYGCGHLIYN